LICLYFTHKFTLVKNLALELILEVYRVITGLFYYAAK
jgi:hypothetical protein